MHDRDAPMKAPPPPARNPAYLLSNSNARPSVGGASSAGSKSQQGRSVAATTSPGVPGLGPDDWPCPVPVPGVPVDRSALGVEKRNAMNRANELMRLDPNDPKSLAALSMSDVDCAVQFKLPYDTAMGEELFIVGSHDRLGAWNQSRMLKMHWGDGGIWYADVELPAGGVFFYKYVLRDENGKFTWQDGANNLLVLPEEWDIPKDSRFVVDDKFGGTTRSSQNMLATKLISCEKEIVNLKLETIKAKEMTKASLQELMITREELESANEKLTMYERNVQTVITSMRQGQAKELNSNKHNDD
ncbi:carbohydrate-binding module family 20 protein [Micromonas pusilla CCMP1545]|uniref:Carbohydrate-binding module family 20 protein n=2 Tax=Micromonas pusilla TaxID=38833 RepID=C1MYS7_MICPC|nr:carbohydrate-binding module family 20 protein [Micromonas pusilla CCMP1545]EEH54486.1 carbohydrate-binding module family 20 protein [Micromonas pusilla CCMP1545]|eukprot:XP_003060836.1 carbohydrate-binding module family 20 protein [Micromonas pusilla CCMP1545]